MEFPEESEESETSPDASENENAGNMLYDISEIHYDNASFLYKSAWNIKKNWETRLNERGLIV